MKAILLCGEGANQFALANRLHAIHPLAHVAFVLPPPGKGRRKLLPRIVSYTAARPLRVAWRRTLASFGREYPAMPKTAVSRHAGANADSVLALINRELPDFVLVSGTDLLRRPLIDAICNYGRVMNLHTGVSPYIKGGPNCTNWALSLGEFDMIGNTVMWLDKGIDSGNLIATERTALNGRESLFELHRKVMDHAHDLYGRCYAQAMSGKPLGSVKQAEMGQGRLFLSKQWTGTRMLRALANYYFHYRPGFNVRPIELVSLNDGGLTTEAQQRLFDIRH